MIEIKLLYANMGNAQCGDVSCVVLIDYAKKLVVTEPQAYTWKQGKLVSNYNKAIFSVAYVQEEILLDADFQHEVRLFTEEEQRLIDAALSMYA
jgi:hypothetical protein